VIGAEVWPRLTLASSSAGSPVTADATAARPDDRKPSTTPRNRRAVGVAASLLLLAGLGLAASLPEGADRSRPPATAGRGAAGSGAGEPDATKADAAEPGTAGASGSSADGTSASDGPVAPPPDAPVGPPGTTFAPPGAAPTAVSTPPAGPADPQPPAGGAAGNLTAPVTVTATATTRCDGDSYTITVSATASTDIATARLELSGASGPGSRPMTTRGGSARAVVGSQTTRSLAWAVSATAVDGRTARYTGAPVTNPCVQPIPG
jgi:hypothetical protein